MVLYCFQIFTKTIFTIILWWEHPDASLRKPNDEFLYNYSHNLCGLNLCCGNHVSCVQISEVQKTGKSEDKVCHPQWHREAVFLTIEEMYLKQGRKRKIIVAMAKMPGSWPNLPGSTATQNCRHGQGCGHARFYVHDLWQFHFHKQ